MNQPSLPLGIKPRQKRTNPEERIQADVFVFLRLYERYEPRFEFIHGSMNGLPLFGKVLATAHRTGLRKGIWDIFCPGAGVWSGSSWSGLYIECKATTGLTPEQKRFRDTYADVYAFVVCRDWLSAARAICQYLSVDHPAILEAIK